MHVVRNASFITLAIRAQGAEDGGELSDFSAMKAMKSVKAAKALPTMKSVKEKAMKAVPTKKVQSAMKAKPMKGMKVRAMKATARTAGTANQATAMTAGTANQATERTYGRPEYRERTWNQTIDTWEQASATTQLRTKEKLAQLTIDFVKHNISERWLNEDEFWQQKAAIREARVNRAADADS